MPFFTKRRKEQEEAAARARGELVDYLSETAPREFRNQLWFAIETVSNDLSSIVGGSFLDDLHHFLCEEYGRLNLAKGQNQFDDLRRFILTEISSTAELMDVIDSVILGLDGAAANARGTYSWSLGTTRDKFVATINRRLREHKLAYDLVEGRIVQKQAEQLHQSVIVPALTLLHGRPQFEEAEIQFRDALDELAAGKWADAVTDANATVENLLRKLVGFSQGQLPDLLAEARKRGLFGDPQSGRIKKVLTGLSALSDIRNAEGDAHGNTSDEETAWLAVYWAGALVVYLVKRAERVN